MFALNRDDICRVLYGEAVPNECYIKHDFVTPEILKKIMPNMHVRRADELAVAINEVSPLYELNRPGVFHEFIAQCAEESGEFNSFEEGLSYSAERLMVVWPKRFPTLASAQPYARNPQKLANKVYANRMGNGDEASGDGWKYRGGGPMQLTGKDMWEAYAKYKGLPVDQVMVLVKTDMKMAVDSAMWVFVVQKGLLDEAEKDQFVTITKAINGGTTNLAKRKVYYERAKQFMPITN